MPEPDRPLDRLLAIMRRLRDPDRGCAWDVAQTFATIAPYTIEEAYEVADAIARGDLADLKDELGDLLLQVVFHARIAEERGAFAFDDVATAIADKMERRHPHIFGDVQHGDHHLWEQIKAEERAAKSDPGALAGVALALPALTRAEKLGKRAARVGFDWPDPSGPRAKIDEELGEIDAAVTMPEVEDEIGDLLFSVANYARHRGIDPEAALRAANAKFERRFRAMERCAEADFDTLDLDAKESLWAEVKQYVAKTEALIAPDVGTFTVAGLRTAGFVGWLPFSALRTRTEGLPERPGVYVVTYGGGDPIQEARSCRCA